MNKSESWDKLIAFLQDDSEQMRADLEEQGVDVDAFLKRINATVRKYSQRRGEDET